MQSLKVVCMKITQIMLRISVAFCCFLLLVSLAGFNSEDNEEKLNKPSNEDHLIHAAAQGNLVELKKAIKAGAHINAKDGATGNCALIWAAFNGHVEVMQALLNSGAYIEIRSDDGKKTPLLMATYRGHLPAVQYLLSKGAYIDAANDRGDTSLAIAAYMGHISIVTELLDRGASDESNKLGYRALHFACFKGFVDVVWQLIIANVEMDLVDHSGKTPLMLAAMEGHADCVRLLLANDAEINVQDRNGNSALILAVNRKKSASEVSPAGLQETVTALTQSSDIPLLDLQNVAGYSAVMAAVGNNHSDVLVQLLNAGASCLLESQEGERALALSEKLNNEVVSTILTRMCAATSIDEMNASEDIEEL